MSFDQKEIDFKVISVVYRKVLPVFGAHPLSNIFNEAPILLVEGEDDERIWRAAMAVEIIHASILMHDDFMDEAEVRRGGPTTTSPAKSWWPTPPPSSERSSSATCLLDRPDQSQAKTLSKSLKAES